MKEKLGQEIDFWCPFEFENSQSSSSSYHIWKDVKNRIRIRESRVRSLEPVSHYSFDSLGYDADHRA